jgi:hypothetical protein
LFVVALTEGVCRNVGSLTQLICVAAFGQTVVPSPKLMLKDCPSPTVVVHADAEVVRVDGVQ